MSSRDPSVVSTATKEALVSEIPTKESSKPGTTSAVEVTLDPNIMTPQRNGNGMNEYIYSLHYGNSLVLPRFQLILYHPPTIELLSCSGEKSSESI
jgi:hypothetical protein